MNWCLSELALDQALKVTFDNSAWTGREGSEGSVGKIFDLLEAS
jgi:hypothetical protein